MSLYDLAIIGGGVNGCGIARDAAGRGLTVFLCDKGDLGGATSSASTKLIHGGLRYLEQREFRLVREALGERETLLKLAPHIIRPMRFVLPARAGGRSWAALRAGLWLYDRLGGRKGLQPSRALDLATDEAGAPLSEPGRAIEYSDCWVDDSRLVILNAVDAAERGAAIVPRTTAVAAQREADLWRLSLDGAVSGEISARALVNATGPWVDELSWMTLGIAVDKRVRLVRGSHIVTRRLFDHDRAYTLQQPDGRVVFAIPFERDFTLIGTTDVDHDGVVDDPEPSEDEIGYLCQAASAAFREPVYSEDVVWSFAGVRPLHAEADGKAQAASRDYALELEGGEGKAPLLTVFGGKLTTYRRLAESALDRLSEAIDTPRGPWTARSALPGGGFHGETPMHDRLRMAFPYLSEPHAERLAGTYGSRAWDTLDGTRSADDLGRVFGVDLTERETRYLIAKEWARTAEDVLWRRTKLGLRFDEAGWDALSAFMPEGRS